MILDDDAEITQHHKFMQVAIKEAKKALFHHDVPIGAIVVHNNKIISRAHNQTQLKKNSTLHAERIVIDKAIKKIGVKYLIDCTLYVTLEPCAMCAGAIVLSRLNKVVIATRDEKAGACGSVENIAANLKLNHRAELLFGVCQEESSQLLKDFFSKLREQKKNAKS